MNLLLDQSRWTDGNSDSPPSIWTGSAYHFTGDDGLVNVMQALATSGDSVRFFLVNNLAIAVPPNHFFTVTVNGAIVYEFDVTATGSSSFDSGPLETGDSVQIKASTQFVEAYSCDITITAPGVVMQFSPEYDVPEAPTSYNCDCDDDFPTSTLAEMTRRIIVRLGYAALTIPPPGMKELVQDFLIQAQKLLYRQYKCFRTERWFTWDMPEGQRFFDFGANNDECMKKLDPRLITWVGVSQGDNNWRELISGINPVRYTSKTTGLSQWFEVRQCIEVWPAMADSTWSLRIKGIFELLPFAVDADVTTIDAEAIFMLALGNAKAHYGQADAGNSISQLQAYIGFLTAGNQPRRRFFPGDRQLPNAVPPKIV